jgi:hypothetical protein
MMETKNAHSSEVMMALARRYFWWGPPSEALQDMPRFVAEVMNWGTWKDVQALWQILGQQPFGEVVAKPPPVFLPQNAGIIGMCVWAFYQRRRCRSDSIEGL